jgi:hypothetical protein
MKRLTTLLLLPALLTGCALFNRQATLNDKLADVEDLAYSAASIGAATTLELKPQYRPAFEAARDALNVQLAGETFTLEALRAILSTLPVKELESPAARLVVDGATRLFRRAVTQETEENVRLYLRAVATGIRDGFNTALGPPAASQSATLDDDVTASVWATLRAVQSDLDRLNAVTKEALYEP